MNYINVLDTWRPFIASGTSRKKGKTKGISFAAGSKERSKTLHRIAEAMATSIRLNTKYI